MSSDPKDLRRRELLKQAVLKIERLERKLAEAGPRQGEPLAIVGMGCRFPGGADNPVAFWERLRDGVDATREIPAERWPVDDYYDPEPETRGKMYTRRGGFLTSPIDRFDPQFFGIAPREADEMDPQQRLLLEVVWETLERAGQSPRRLSGSNTGVFLGMSTHDWAQLHSRTGDTMFIDTYYGTGVAHSVAAGRLAYVLGLKGPAITIDTACSSSLVAFHQACLSLRARETDMAIAAGVCLILAPDGHIIASKGRMLAPDGRCKTFGASADGYGRGEGCGVLLLKRLEDAKAAGDRVLALVHGTAINQDGRSGGLTAPNGKAQEEVMRAALKASGLKPGDLSYVETHGTGTELGDPIEVQALGAVHAAGRDADHPLWIGSVKTNLGHLESAAGIAGMIKTVLAFDRGSIPPHLHFDTPNPLIDWAGSPVAVPTKSVDWPDYTGRRLAGISSFGFSGTNAHVILEAAPADSNPAVEPSVRTVHPVPISGRTEQAAKELAAAVADAVEADPSLEVEAVASTLARGRAHWEFRRSLIAADRESLIAALRQPDTVGEAQVKVPPRVAFLYTGQGSQSLGMGSALYEREPVFRAAIDRCEQILQTKMGESIKDCIFGAGDPDAAAAKLNKTQYAQPALFAVEYALTELWRSWGIVPSIVMGHSVGEYAAACAAGILKLEDALGLIAERGRLMGALPEGGAMVAIFATEEQVSAALEGHTDRVAIAALNGPRNIVISGDAAGVEAVVGRLAADGIKSKALVVSHAFHSPLMDPMLEDFRRVASHVRIHDPAIDLIANRTGALAGRSTFSADYWVEHVRSPVRFTDSVATLFDEGVRLLVEIGPSPTLVGMAARCEGADGSEVCLPSLRPKRDESETALGSLGKLYEAGQAIDWDGVFPSKRPPVDLPTYPFQRQRHWHSLQKSRSRTVARGGHPLLGPALRSPRIAETIYQTELRADDPSWLDEHRVFDKPVLPAAAYLEMAASAARDRFGQGAHRVAGMAIHEPMILSSDAARVVQCVIQPDGNRFEILSRSEYDNDESAWTLHAKGALHSAADCPAPGDSEGAFGDDGDDRAAADGDEVDVQAYYAAVRDAGVAYGPRFRGLARIRRTDAAAWAELQTTLTDAETAGYVLHPALLDACFQVSGVALQDPASTSEDVYLPLGVDGYRVFAAAEGDLTCIARLRDRTEGNDETFACDIEIRNAAGAAVASVEGIRFKKADRATLRSALAGGIEDSFYEIDWVETEPGAVPAEGGSWLVAGLSPHLDAVAAAFKDRKRLSMALPLDNLPLDSIEQEIESCFQDAIWDGVLIVHDPAPDGSESDDTWEERVGPTLRALCAAARQAAGGTNPRKLAVLTRGARSDRPDREPTDPFAATLWGFGQSAASELPDAGCRRIDLDPASQGSEEELARAVALVLADDTEDQWLLRGDRRSVARLVPWRGDAAGTQRLKIPAGDYGLTIPARGVLDRLQMESVAAAAPQAGEVEIDVQTTGLNFRDVLNVLGMYPGDAGALGSECVGLVTRVGDGVEGLAPGDRVMAITPRGFCSRVSVSQFMCAPVPESLDSVAAATIPIAFLTADWAILHLGRLQPGERVLIHAAAGGVGMAAVQLALEAGAEVFATVGSRRKRMALERMGVRHIYDSRSTSFQQEILRDTGGEGVHMVLNSLADEFIGASFEALRPDGRFLEIGKTGVWDQARVGREYPDVFYQVVYLGEACLAEPETVRRRFLGITERLAQGKLKPLPHRSFPLEQAIAAFRFMAQAKHLGKVVLIDPRHADSIGGNQATWITGGAGGLGMAMARRYAAQGVERIVLSGRSELGDETRTAIAELEDVGASVLYVRADVARWEDVQRVVEQASSQGWSLQRIVHSAGLLDDAVIANQNWERLQRVFAPKVSGGWNLHRIAEELPIEELVLFSAGAAWFGAPGQANYAAANAFLDGLASYRYGLGQPALSIAWGPWQEAGMAARAGSDWESQGIGGIRSDDGFEAVERLVAEGATQAAVLPMDWGRFLRNWPAGERPPLLRGIQAEASTDSAGATAGSAVGSWLEELSGTPADKRHELLGTLVLGQVIQVLGLDPQRPPSRGAGLTDLGMDSLMAVELSNRLGAGLEMSLPSTIVFEYPTLKDLAEYLADEALDSAEPDVQDSQRTDAPTEKVLEEEVRKMSEEEVEANLLDELDNIGF